MRKLLSLLLIIIVLSSVSINAFAAQVDIYPESGQNIVRVYGKTRYETSFAIADATKEKMGVEKFENVIIASGTGFADALAGSYLAKVKSAPILLSSGTNHSALKEYISKNMSSDGTVYILGGNVAVPETVEEYLGDFAVKRIKGATRYDTNIEILKEAGVSDEPILVCTGLNFADSLSASAVGLPILLVDNNKSDLSLSQKNYISTISPQYFCIIGGTAAVSYDLAEVLDDYSDITRICGKTRYETSVKIAEEFFYKPTSAVVTYSENFPDGLCGGPLAMSLNTPMILAKTKNHDSAWQYTYKYQIKDGLILGGESLIDNSAVRNIFINEYVECYYCGSREHNFSRDKHPMNNDEVMNIVLVKYIEELGVCPECGYKNETSIQGQACKKCTTYFVSSPVGSVPFEDTCAYCGFGIKRHGVLDVCEECGIEGGYNSCWSCGKKECNLEK